MNTADKLRRRRASLGLTQAAVAQRAGMSTVQYNGYENERHEPSEATMARLAKALKVEPDDLWADEYSEDQGVTELRDSLRKKVAESLGVSVSAIRISIEMM